MCENVRVLSNVPLAEFTTFGIGGNAKRLVVTSDADVLAEEYAGTNPVLIGGGSNLLIGDGGVNGTVVRYVSDLCEPSILSCGDGEAIVHVSGATRLSRLCRWAADNSLGGLEWAAGIVGSVGGAVKMNAGAHGADMKSVLTSVDVLSEGKTRTLPTESLNLDYRKSDFCGIAVGAAFRLTQKPSELVRNETARLLSLRRAAQPSGKSAGSVFRAVDGIPAYKYIDGAGLRGCRIGGAAVSEKHANFIINTGGATAKDVASLIRKIEEEVFRKYGIALKREVVFIGEF